MVRRKFTPTQKLLILRRAGYCCQSCGTPLDADSFEADHFVAYSLGGVTEVYNAQALCLSCNRHTSNKPYQS